MKKYNVTLTFEAYAHDPEQAARFAARYVGDTTFRVEQDIFAAYGSGGQVVKIVGSTVEVQP